MARSRHKNSRRTGRAPRIKKSHQPGVVPENWVAPPGSAETRVRTICFDEEHCDEQHLSRAEQVDRILTQPGVKWVHVSGLGNPSELEHIGRAFKIHPLAIEDVVSSHQRAKVEEYPEQLFIVARTVYTEQDRVHTEQLSMFLGRDYLLTFQAHDHGELEPVRDRLRRARGSIRQGGPDYLVYAILDTVIDAYFPIVDGYGEHMEELDMELTHGKAKEFMASLHDLRGDLMLLRRAVRPLRDSILHLMPDQWSHIRPETQVYLRDCYDHTVQLMDLLDTYRELASDLRDYYMSAISNRMNEIVKVLTIISTIFMPLSFIAGVYGMNFNTQYPANMPELNWSYGYVASLTVMGLVAAVQLYWFWRKGWLS